jgi:hypothetical protein
MPTRECFMSNTLDNQLYDIAEALSSNSGYNLPSRSCFNEMTSDYQLYNLLRALGDNIDPDAQAYINASGATEIQGINLFVKGIKNLGLWENMVCWPLRSAQNAGTGSTAYSLGGLGTYNGTLVNGPTWGTDGIAFVRTSTQHITTTLALNGTQNCTFFAANSTTDDGGGSGGIISLMGTRNAGAVTTTVCVAVADNGGNFIESSFIINPPAVTARPANPYSSTHVFEPTQPILRVGANGGALTLSIPLSAPLGGTQPNLVIGHAGPVLSDRGFNGTMHFTSVFANLAMSQSQSLALHSLLKQTLGQGLGLP